MNVITITLTEKEVATICKALDKLKRRLYEMAENERIPQIKEIDSRNARECYDIQSKLTMLRYKCQ